MTEKPEIQDMPATDIVRQRGTEAPRIGSVLPSLPPRPDKVQAMHLAVQRIQTISLGVCAVLLISGLVVALLTDSALPTAVVPIGEAAGGVLALDPAALLSVGLLLLLVTPIVRVAGTVINFLRQQDLRYALVTAMVLSIMLLSIFLGDW